MLTASVEIGRFIEALLVVLALALAAWPRQAQEAMIQVRSLPLRHGLTQ